MANRIAAFLLIVLERFFSAFSFRDSRYLQSSLKIEILQKLYSIRDRGEWKFLHSILAKKLLVWKFKWDISALSTYSSTGIRNPTKEFISVPTKNKRKWSETSYWITNDSEQLGSLRKQKRRHSPNKRLIHAEKSAPIIFWI